MDAPQPKCVRLVVTAIYADGSSRLYDLKDPERCDISLSKVKDASEYFPPELVTIRSNRVALEVNAIVDGKSPAYISTYPVSGK